MKINLVSKLHNSTKRNYLKRMNDDKVYCMKIAKKYGKNYWDGNRRFGYGGYKYIPGRWKKVAEKIIKLYKLKAGSKLLDVGCGKGFLLKELMLIQPKLKIYGFDISNYAIKKSFKQKNIKLFKHKAETRFPFKSNYFDLVISLATLHNLKFFNLNKAIKEIERVGKKKYIMVESYRNDKELFNLQCWALTCESFFSEQEWTWIYKNLNYSGDYEFIYFN
tara:strand:- start:497 stop:1156 length:660 start_codon:yes stop_codon:yes gene_type:complete